VQTSAIAYRVVDFLKGYPPFQSMEEPDLLALVAGGRVRFHEVDEFVYWQGRPYDPFFFVIQQGSVSLWEQSRSSEEQLKDIRGAGDLLSIDRFLGKDSHMYSAKAESDIVLYALPAGDFQPLLEKYPRAAQYLAAHASVSAYYEPSEEKRRLDRMYAYEAVRERPLITCSPEDDLRHSVGRMLEAGVSAAAVVDAKGALLGVLTSEGVLRWLAGDGVAARVRAEAAMSGVPPTLPADVTAARCVLEMAGAREAAVAITDGGRKDAPVHGLVTPGDLAPAFGEQPIQLLDEIAHASDLTTLSTLNQRSRALLQERLVGPSSVDWLSELAARVDGAIVSRAARLSGLAVAAADEKAPACWFQFGASGRQESITALQPQLGLIVRDDAHLEDQTGAYRRLCSALAHCGYHPRGGTSGLDIEFRCATLAEWKARFGEWIRQPVMSRVYQSRPLFDLRPTFGAPSLLEELRATVASLVAEQGAFLRLLAHDCLDNLPPLSFYRDLVVEETGERHATFHLERSGLRPLVDVGRVFGIATGKLLGGSTLERFGLARVGLPDHEAVFREASDTLRVMLFHQARSGLRRQDGGTDILPAGLSHHDRQVLKSGFRATARLLEFTAACEWLPGGR